MCFISCLDSHSDGTHSLQRIQQGTNDVLLNFSQSVQMKEQSDLHLGRPLAEGISFSKLLGELFL